ncbi:hypothetical protein COCMIDRAFT_110829 [Bipolaris oryzae ATCC 44560]|uniref:Uncharacterized protein n=1 Tax=Bipolaris oryzae ATCC 44560 TaxID=930090 RepID=W6YKJ5_COCMI|nr:uncharacterized protein COCMIDRAFT_110829 [Bipolaris oryzae ATCC 44560]EUC39687.1 hypothetical protein COCMIDRAFT_110829 [Bipolaris oryzae ATCC 44560]
MQSPITPDPTIQKRYEVEREKRIRPDAEAQFLDLNTAETLSDLNKDIWVNHETLNNSNSPVRDGGFYEVLILGAGYGGLLFAARLIQAGILPEGIRIVDNAGGFGGTWYWNRYPGLMCDVESYMYMPLLEETGYMPKHRYAYGPELLQHANRIASHFNLENKALFRSHVTEMRWDDQARHWMVQIYENRGPTKPGQTLSVKSRFVITTGGILNVPHVPNVQGLTTTKIPLFHSARWRYDLTGGTPTEQRMEKLKEKRVGIIGTGPTAIQIVPELAKWSKHLLHLLVFQRTPTSCDVRGQRPTDPDEWKQITAQKGWQRERIHNFNHFVRGEPLQVDLVQDGWCQMPSFSALIGSARKGKIQPEDVKTHIAELDAIDFPRAQRLRERVDNVVHDKKTAEKLKSWYPTYCKRPTFHDEYLQSFNRPNVELIETSGFGVEKITERGVIVNGVEHEVDLLVISTGFRTTSRDGVKTPSRDCNIEVFGRHGLNLNDKWDANGPTTLHGCCTHDFPNLFFNGMSQTGAACNLAYVLDNHARTVAYYIQSARKATKTNTFAIEPSRDAEEEWANESASMSNWFAALSPCTPGYFNNYAKKITDPLSQQKLARAAPWGFGSQDYIERIEKWCQSGSLQGLLIST